MERGYISIFEDEVVIVLSNLTLWLTLNQIADLFECFTASISSNIRVVLKAEIIDGSEAVFHERTSKGDITVLYNLEMVIALAYRIKTRNTKILRKWIANQLNYHSIILPLSGDYYAIN